MEGKCNQYSCRGCCVQQEGYFYCLSQAVCGYPEPTAAKVIISIAFGLMGVGLFIYAYMRLARRKVLYFDHAEHKARIRDKGIRSSQINVGEAIGTERVLLPTGPNHTTPTTRNFPRTTPTQGNHKEQVQQPGINPVLEEQDRVVLPRRHYQADQHNFPTVPYLPSH